MPALQRDRVAPPSVPGILRPLARAGDATGFAVAGIVVVVAFGLAVSKTRTVVAAELDVDQFVSAHHTAPLTSFALGIDWVFSPLQAVILTMVLSLAIVWRTGSLRPAAVFAAVVASGWLSSAVLKEVVHRPRPDALLLAHPYLPTPTDYSYPSGHTVFAAALAFGLILLARGTRWQRPAIVVGSVGAVVVALSRVYLGVHYPSDVTASLIWAPSVGVLVLAVIHRAGSRARHVSPPSIA